MMSYFQAGNSIIAKKEVLFVSGILKIKHEACRMHSLAHAAVSTKLALWLTVGKGDGQAYVTDAILVSLCLFYSRASSLFVPPLAKDTSGINPWIFPFRWVSGAPVL